MSEAGEVVKEFGSKEAILIGGAALLVIGAVAWGIKKFRARKNDKYPSKELKEATAKAAAAVDSLNQSKETLQRVEETGAAADVILEKELQHSGI